MSRQPETISQADFLEAFGITETPPADEPPVTEPDTTEGDGETPPADDTPPEGTPPPDDTPPAEEPPAATPPVADQKAANAFAQMRVENTTLKKTLESVAELLGLTDVKDPDQLASSIKTKVLEAQAKQSNVPVEILQKLDRLQGLEQQFTETQLKTQAAVGFQGLVTQYGLNNDQLVAFAQELINNGMNPYEKQVDVVREYKILHYDELVSAAAEKARQEEAARAAKAASQSSTPGSTKGGNPGGQGKINSVKELDNYFSGM